MKYQSFLTTTLLISFVIFFSANSIGAEKIEITDSHGKWVFDSPPKRVAIINWTLSEQILELGVIPIAIADLAGFKQIAPQTKVAPNIIDLGSRFTPNLNQLRELAPELIIIGYSQRDLLRPLSNIAPVMYFNNFSRRFDNASKADERFTILAKLFGKTAFANELLQNRDEQISNIASSLNTDFNGELPRLTIASIKNDDAWLFLNNSIPFSVTQRLGFKPSPIEKKPSKLGTHKISLQELSTLKGCVLFLNSNHDLRTDASESMAVKNQQCWQTLKTTNAYGGSLSQLYLAQAIQESFDSKKVK